VLVYKLLDDRVSNKLVHMLDEKPVSLTYDQVSMGVVCMRQKNKQLMKRKE
jgi:hypothetical protein